MTKHEVHQITAYHPLHARHSMKSDQHGHQSQWFHGKETC